MSSPLSPLPKLLRYLLEEGRNRPQINLMGYMLATGLASVLMSQGIAGSGAAHYKSYRKLSGWNSEVEIGGLEEGRRAPFCQPLSWDWLVSQLSVQCYHMSGIPALGQLWSGLSQAERPSG